MRILGIFQPTKLRHISHTTKRLTIFGNISSTDLLEIGGKISEICRKSEAKQPQICRKSGASTPPNFGEMAEIGILNFGEMAEIGILNFGEMEFFSVNT